MNTANPRLENSIRAILQPHLKEDGFNGSGRTFRRLVNGWVQVVNVQGSRYGGQFAINFGIQPISIPDSLGNPVDPKKITEPLCEFRRRLTEGEEDQWWKHEDSQSSMDKAVLAATEVYVRIGRPLLEKVAGDRSPFTLLSAADFITEKFDLLGFRATEARMALVFARMRKAEGKTEESKGFATYGLGCVGRATGLRAKLQELSGLGRES